MQVTDPDTLTTKPPENLEEFAVFSVCVAGKTARVIRQCLQARFWPAAIAGVVGTQNPEGWNLLVKAGPFEIIRHYDTDALAEMLRKSGIGCQTMKARALHALAWIYASGGLDKVTPKELEKISGIGPKTARFFVLYTQPGAKVACLDTHVLHWMREQGIDAPKATPPSGKRYRELEEQFLSLVPKNKTIAEFDLEIWMRYRR